MSSTLDPSNRTFIGSVVFVDIVGYSKKSVSEQISMKDRFTSLLTDSLKSISPDQRIILDTGDGAALCFLGDPEDALFVGMHMRDFLQRIDVTLSELSIRTGINLGPIKLVRDINGHPNIVGDGINVAQRIMSFARPGQIVVSRSYFDVVSVISDEYAQLFKYEGSRTDKHVREHEIYVVGESDAAFNKAKAGMEDRAASTNPPRPTQTPAPGPSPAAMDKGAMTGSIETDSEAAPGVPLLQDRKKLGMIGGALGAAVLLLAILVAVKKPATDAAKPDAAKVAAAAPAGATSPVPVAPEPSVAEPVKDAAKDAPKEASKDSPKETAKEAPKEAKNASKLDKDKVAASDAAKTDAPKPVVQSTVNFAVKPWGEVFVNGRAIGVSPPLKQHKLAPGKYKIEIRNTTFTPYVSNVEVKSKEELTIRHNFQ